MRPTLLLTVLALAVGCAPNEADTLPLAPTPIRSLQQSWAVVTVPMVPVLEAPNEDAATVTLLYRGTIAEVDSIAPRRDLFKGRIGRWVEIHHQGRRGWVFSTSVEVFENLQLARRRVQALRLSLESPSQ